MARLLCELRVNQFAKLHSKAIFDAVINALSSFLASQDTGRCQQCEMLGNIRLCCAGSRHDVGNSVRRFTDNLQNLQAHWFAKQSETPGNLLEFLVGQC